MSTPVALSIDLGGTDLKVGIVSRAGELLCAEVFPSHSKERKSVILRHLVCVVEEQILKARQKKWKMLGVGFGIPGIVSYPDGVVCRSPHFPDFKNYPLKRELKKHLSLPFVLDNDANMAALGESWKGSARGKKNFILLTLGTGIGGGVFLNGKILHGDSGFAGEAGHLVIEREGRVCNCGGRGCLEMYASATGIACEARQLNQPERSPEEWCRLALQNHTQAKKIYQSFGAALGAGIASIVNLTDIETVILGGGVAAAWKAFQIPMKQALKCHLYSTTFKRLAVKRALLKNTAGMIGSAKALFDHVSASG